MKKSITTLIQGPLNNISLKNIMNYEKFGPVIVSHWDVGSSETKNKFPIIKELKKIKRVKFITNPLPNLNDKIGILKDSTFYWALVSTYKGLTECQTEYIVKTRSDEYYTNLKPMIAKAMKFNGKKFVCGNIFVKDYQEYPMHIGDHVFCLKTSDMILMYKNLYRMYNGRQKFESWAKHGPTTAEQIIGYSFLKYVKRVSADEIYKNLCSIVPLNKFIMPQHKLKKITKFMPVSVAKNINVIYKNMLSWILRRNRAKNSKKKLLNIALQSTYVIDINCLGHYQVSWAHLKKIWNSKKNKFTNHFEKIQNQKDLANIFYNK